MRRALGTLSPRPSLRADRRLPGAGLGVPATAVWKGDATVACIAAASILAKVTRDAIMTGCTSTGRTTSSPSTRATSPAHAAALDQPRAVPGAPAPYVNVRGRCAAIVRGLEPMMTG